MKIATIAMSGVRACDEELLRLGLTLPGFVERSKVIASLPSLGLLTLAGMTPASHTVDYLEVCDHADASVADGGYDLVAISTFTAQAPEAYELADRFLARGTPVVFGGLHATALPEEASAHATAVVRGEGEVVWPELLADAQRGRLRPVYDARGREFDLADAPMPAFELLDPERYNRLTVQVTRGCPWRCEFCASSILLTDQYKHKPIPKVLAEIDRIRSLWRRPFIELADDNSIRNRAYWLELLPALARRRVRWFTETDISVGDDPELLDLLRQSGCVELLIGLESPDQTGLKNLELRRDWKRAQAHAYLRRIRAIQSHGIRVNGCFILGLDGQTAQVFDDVLGFAREAELYDVQITMPTPFPGTPLLQRLRREGRLLDEAPWRRCTLFDVTFRPSHMTPAELRQGFIDLTRRLYSEEETRRRRDTFHRRYGRAQPPTGDEP